MYDAMERVAGLRVKDISESHWHGTLETETVIWKMHGHFDFRFLS